MAVNNEYIKEFITDVEGTYAQIEVASGPLIGKGLFQYKQPDNIKKAERRFLITVSILKQPTFHISQIKHPNQLGKPVFCHS